MLEVAEMYDSETSHIALCAIDAFDLEVAVYLARAAVLETLPPGWKLTRVASQPNDGRWSQMVRSHAREQFADFCAGRAAEGRRICFV